MKTTEEKNRMIAEFIGHVRSGFNGELVFNTETREEFEVEQLKYHTSWDWLMPVVEKIEILGYHVETTTTLIGIRNPKHNKDFYVVGVNIENLSKIEASYNAVIQFIEWYNENKD